MLDRSISRVTDHIARISDANLLLEWPVHSIEYTSQGAIVRGSAGRQLSCSKVIVTVPIAILQRGDILFRPSMPPEKLAAIARIKMCNAIKVRCILVFGDTSARNSSAFITKWTCSASNHRVLRYMCAFINCWC